MPAELDEAVIVEWLKRSRSAQGLPERITDAGLLAKVVTLALAPTAEHNGKGGGAAGGGP
jgi:hypothetical protein